MFAWLKNLVPERKRASRSEATALALSQALGGRCPRCRSDLRDHVFQLFAITVAEPEQKQKLSDFIRKAKSHEWQSLSKYQDFEPSKNALEVYAVRCVDERLNMILARNPFELFDRNSVEDCEALDEGASSEWSGYLRSEKWVPFAGAGESS